VCHVITVVKFHLLSPVISEPSELIWLLEWEGGGGGGWWLGNSHT